MFTLNQNKCIETIWKYDKLLEFIGACVLASCRTFPIISQSEYDQYSMSGMREIDETNSFINKVKCSKLTSH